MVHYGRWEHHSKCMSWWSWCRCKKLGSAYAEGALHAKKWLDIQKVALYNRSSIKPLLSSGGPYLVCLPSNASLSACGTWYWLHTQNSQVRAQPMELAAMLASSCHYSNNVTVKRASASGVMKANVQLNIWLSFLWHPSGEQGYQPARTTGAPQHCAKCASIRLWEGSAG